jgi:hypothetical protein
MEREMLESSVGIKSSDAVVNRYGRKKGDIKVRPGRPGVILVDCPANDWGRDPNIIVEFATPERLAELERRDAQEEAARLAAMTPQERAAKDARAAEMWEMSERFCAKYPVNEQAYREWEEERRLRREYYEEIYGTHEEIYGQYAELYGK